MIKITLFVKSKNKEEDYSAKNSFSIERPKEYKDLYKTIKNKFNINNDDFALCVFDKDEEDDININDDEIYNDQKYQSQTDYKVFLEEDPFIIGENIYEFIDNTLNLKNDLLIDDAELFNNFDFSTTSSDSNNLGLSVNDLKNENIYEEKTDQNELYNYFIDDFSKKISSQTEEQKKLFIESINKDLLNVDKVINENIKEFDKKVKIYSEKVSSLQNDVDGLKNIINKINGEKVEKISVGKVEGIDDENVEKSSVGKVEGTNIENVEKPSVEKVERTNIENVERLSVEKVEVTNIENVEKPSVEKVEVKNIENVERLSVGNVEEIDGKAEGIDDEKVEENGKEVLAKSKIEEIYNYLDEQYVVSGFLEKKEVFEKIIKLNGDIKKLCEFVEAEI